MLAAVLGCRQRNGANVQQPEIDRLINELGQAEPAFSSLGAPMLADTPVTERLVKVGPPAVPSLVAALDREPKVAAYAAKCLGEIGDRSALPALQRTQARYSSKESKVPYDMAVVASTSLAVERLSQSNR
jgi:hypothetical protein